MTYFRKTKFRIATLGLILVTSAAATTTSAQGLGIPIPPTLDFPKQGAFEGRSGNCFLFIRFGKPKVTKNAVTIKLGE